jgi:creatinine amidohydrolase/Fe(II)-dependent formamide hydrolase-like protein
MRHPHKWEEMLPEEFYEEFNRAPIAYWGCGAMEEHGLQNALGTDPYTAYEICLRAVEISGGILFPPVPFAPAGVPGYSREELRRGEKQLYYPSLWTSRELCKQIYLELMESMADMGFKVCMANGGHWPADLLLQEIEQEKGGRIGKMKFWGGGTIRLLREALAAETQKDPTISGHGMMWETSLVMAFRPDWVDLERAQRINENPLPSQLKGQSAERMARIADANSEFGNRMLNLAAEQMAKLAQEMLGMKREE